MRQLTISRLESRRVSMLAATADGRREGTRDVPEECPVALVYDGGTQAVMMATPADIEDFALGFSLTEGIVKAADEITRMEVIEQPAGIEARMWLRPDTGRVLASRRRSIAGPTGCGLCGVDSLEAVHVNLPRSDFAGTFAAAEISAAIAGLPPLQSLNAATRAVHAAAFWQPGAGIAAVREDVGRHNALDKLVGALAAADIDASAGVVLLTSRVSVEMVQKTARLGAPVLVAVSAPTGFALDVAEAAGITVIGIARDDGFEIFTNPNRISQEP